MSFVAGIDIGGTNTVIGLVNSSGDCIEQATIPTRIDGSFTDFIEKVSQTILQLVEGKNLQLKGIGVGAPNGSYNLGAIVDAPNLVWKGILPVCKELNERLNVPTVLTNDANAAAIGEMLFGAAKDYKHFIVITLGTGLGSGIVIEGKLLVGHDGFAGEFGHTSVKPWGRQCGCGKRGCLETYVSAPGIRRTAFKLLADANQHSILRTYSYEQLTAKCITQAALKGDRVAREAFEYTGKILGQKLADLVALFSPQAIFLFGGLSNAGDLIFDPTKRNMEENLFPIFRNKVSLLPSGLKNENAAVLGAAALAWNEIGGM